MPSRRDRAGPHRQHRKPAQSTGKGSGPVTAEKSEAELREELRLVEDDIESLRRSAMELRRSVGEDEPADFADRAAAIAAADEQESLAEQLEARREELVKRLGTAS
jgi:hypothetical protein